MQRVVATQLPAVAGTGQSASSRQYLRQREADPTVRQVAPSTQSSARVQVSPSCRTDAVTQIGALVLHEKMHFFPAAQPPLTRSHTVSEGALQGGAPCGVLAFQIGAPRALGTRRPARSKNEGDARDGRRREGPRSLRHPF